MPLAHDKCRPSPLNDIASLKFCAISEHIIKITAYASLIITEIIASIVKMMADDISFLAK